MDIALAIAAGVQAFAAVMIWRLTHAYVKATQAIRDANSELVAASQASVDALRDGLRLQEREPSLDAAGHLHDALLTFAGLALVGGDDDERAAALSGAFPAWHQAALRHGGVLQDEVLRTEVERFTALVRVPATDMASLRDIADHEGRRLPNPFYRLSWAIGVLAAALANHQRGETVNGPRLPAEKHNWVFWEIPPGTDPEVWQENLADPDYDPPSSSPVGN